MVITKGNIFRNMGTCCASMRRKSVLFEVRGHVGVVADGAGGDGGADAGRFPGAADLPRRADSLAAVEAGAGAGQRWQRVGPRGRLGGTLQGPRPGSARGLLAADADASDF